MRDNIKYFLFLLVIIVSYGLVEYYRPKEINWNRSYRNDQTIPFATKAIYELLPGLFPKQPVKQVRLPIYNFLQETPLPRKSTYLIIGQDSNTDSTDTALLLTYVAKGNTVFLAGNELSTWLLKPFGLRTEMNQMLDYDKPIPTDDLYDEAALRVDTMQINFINEKFRKKGGYILERETAENVFLTDSLTQKADILGISRRGQVNFIRLSHGKGTLLLHTVPEVFSNYYLMKDGDENYAFRALSYLPDAPLFWDEYTEQGREGEASVLRFLLAEKSLKWAYYIALVALVMFILIEAKRRQRVIPVINSPANSSLEFVETVGQLYYQQGNHANIAEKKINYWLAYLRQRLGIKTTELDDDFKAELAQKSGIDSPTISRLVGRVGQVRYFMDDLPENQLIDLSNQLEDFYKKMK